MAGSPAPGCDLHSTGRVSRRRWLCGCAGAVLLPAIATAEDAVGGIKAAYRRYVAALTARDGAAAATMVTAASLEREERLRELALTAAAETVAALPPADRLAVLRLRHEFTAAELAPLDGADLVRIAVEEAWTSPKPLAVLTVTGVEQDGAVATLRVERGGEPVPVRLVLGREAGRWKLDLVELARGSDAALARTIAFRAERAKVPAEEVLRWIVEDSSGHLVDKDLSRPLQGG
ncbi:MAG: hypothetical protein AB7I59_27580 [Geminicoccaceae bacterium]